MPKEDFSIVYKTLLLFASMKEADEKQFTSFMHTYLLASPRARRALIQTWNRALDRPTDKP